MAAKIGPSLPKTVHLRVLAGFTSIVEAIGFPNRRHQQSVVSERVQQESDVLKKAYTHGREQQKNRLLLSSSDPGLTDPISIRNRSAVRGAWSWCVNRGFIKVGYILITLRRPNSSNPSMKALRLSSWRTMTSSKMSVLSVVIDTLQLGSSCSLTACLAMFFLFISFVYITCIYLGKQDHSWQPKQFPRTNFG